MRLNKNEVRCPKNGSWRYFISQIVSFVKPRLFSQTEISSLFRFRRDLSFQLSDCFIMKNFLEFAFYLSCHERGEESRIPTVKLKIPGKGIFEIRNQNFCYIQVIIFDLSYLPVAAVGLSKSATMKKCENIFWYFWIFFKIFSW